MGSIPTQNNRSSTMGRAWMPGWESIITITLGFSFFFFFLFSTLFLKQHLRQPPVCLSFFCYFERSSPTSKANFYIFILTTSSFCLVPPTGLNSQATDRETPSKTHSHTFSTNRHKTAAIATIPSRVALKHTLWPRCRQHR